MKKKIGELFPELTAAVLLTVLSAYLLGGDVWTFWTWWLLALFMGMVAMPVTGRLFGGFEDRGWLFSKVLAIAVTGFLTWLLVAVEILSFTAAVCVGVSVAVGILCAVLFHVQLKHGIECYPSGKMQMIFREELLFFGIFLLWTYLAGFRPQAYGTEKFMDYGFMEAMMRSKTLPARDLWYSQGTINYYYGGQYFAVFLTKLTGSRVEVTYNLMRTFVAAFAFVYPFSLVRQMTKDRLYGRLDGKKKYIPSLAGVTAGIAVSIAGNVHYIVYRCVLPLIRKIQGVAETASYWFPDATRYIGYNPVNDSDKTIHEFPCYSFVLGDLHAHVVNVMFVTFLVGMFYAWLKMIRKRGPEPEKQERSVFWLRQLLMPHILLASVFLGMFQWTNYWDFVIYFVVTGGVVLIANIIRFEGKIIRILAVTIVQAVEIIGLSYLVILPFTLKFDTMVQGVALAQHHSLWYQLLILWGLPVLLTVLLILSVITEKMKGLKHKSLYRLLEAITVPDLFAVIMGLCAIGLVLIPELVYVRDIYENGNARANTMFKLTYQAFILFGICMSYIITRFLLWKKERILQVFGGIGLVLLLWTFGYFGTSVYSWFGNVFDLSEYRGLDATAYLENVFSEDAGAIRWLDETIKGQPVVLEANGDSYSDYERVSAMTGLPTVLGWYVHEWLWRGDPADLNVRAEDVKQMYTSADTNEVLRLLEQYHVTYIFVGSKEKEKYGDALNESLLQSIGDIVYQDTASGTYILQVQDT
jgi:uncharacterized membrane protein